MKNLMLVLLFGLCALCNAQTCIWPTPTNTQSECGPGSLMLTFLLFLIPFTIAHILAFYFLLKKLIGDSSGTGLAIKVAEAAATNVVETVN